MNDALFTMINGLAGRSWTFDSLLAMAVENPVVKAGPICACFIYAWWSGGSADVASRTRSILLITLASLFIIAPTTKLISEELLAPRPFVAAHQIYTFDGGELIPSRPIEYRIPRSGEIAERVAALEKGQVRANDLVTFPSDHAGFYFALSLGIALASRGAGLLALAWAILITLGSRVAAGLHSPLDIAGGAAIGALILILLYACTLRWGERLVQSAAAWSLRHEGMASALLFLLLLEIANAMQTFDRLIEIASARAGWLL